MHWRALIFVSLLSTAAWAQEPAPEPPKPDEKPAEPEKPDEVRVRGTREPSRTVSLSRQEVRQIPGAFGDPFRAVEIMPGVTPIVSGLPFFFIRGAPPGNVGYYLDGVRIPLLFHVGAGPSVIHPALINRVDLYPGGYPARFGRFSGGIVSGETAPPLDRPHGEINLRVFDAGAMIEVPFGKDNRGTILAGGRYSYTAAILSLFASDTILNYWDYQTRVSYKLTDDDTVSAFLFGSYDYLGQETATQTVTVFGTEFHRADIRYDKRLGDKGTFRVAVERGDVLAPVVLANGTRERPRTREADARCLVSIVRARRKIASCAIASSAHARSGRTRCIRRRSFARAPICSSILMTSRSPATRSRHPSRVSRTSFQRAPISTAANAFEVRTRGQAYGLEVFLKRKLTSRLGGFLSYLLSSAVRALAATTAAIWSDRAFGVRADAVVEVVPGLQVTPGIRTDFFTSQGNTAQAVDPRLAVRTEINSRARLLAAMARQLQRTMRRRALSGSPGFQPGGLRGGLQKAYQQSAGIEVDLLEATTGTLTVFHNAFDDMSDPLGASS